MEIPASNSPTPAATIRTAQSAFEKEEKGLHYTAYTYAKMLGELPHSKATKEEPAPTLKSLALFPYLRSSSDHVLNEVSVSRGINDGDVVLACFEFPQGNINGDTTLTLSFQLVQDPGIFEGTFAHLKI